MSDSSQPVPTDVPSLPPAPRRRWWVTLLLGLLIFASGLVTGSGGTLIAVRNRTLRAIHHPEEVPSRLVGYLRPKLKLSPEQSRQVEAVLRTRQQGLQTIRRDVQPRVMAELDAVESEISAVLDAGQRKKWQAMFADLRETWLPPPPSGDQ